MRTRFGGDRHAVRLRAFDLADRFRGCDVHDVRAHAEFPGETDHQPDGFDLGRRRARGEIGGVDPV